MYIRDKSDGPCSHYIDVAECCPCCVKSGKEGKVREPGVHAVHSGDNIGSVCPDNTPVVHLVNPDVSGGLPDDLGNFAVCVKVSRTAGADAELSHSDPGVFVGEQITCQAFGRPDLIEDGTGKLCGKGGIDIFYFKNAFLKFLQNLLIRDLFFQAAAHIALNIHIVVCEMPDNKDSRSDGMQELICQHRPYYGYDGWEEEDRVCRVHRRFGPFGRCGSAD